MGTFGDFAFELCFVEGKFGVELVCVIVWLCCLLLVSFGFRGL